jgi:hypothetical protein
MGALYASAFHVVPDTRAKSDCSRKQAQTVVLHNDHKTKR